MSNGFQPYLDEQTQNRILNEMRRQLLMQPPRSLGFTPRPSPLTTHTPNPNLDNVINSITRSGAAPSPSFNRGLGVRQESRIHKPTMPVISHNNPAISQNSSGTRSLFAGIAAVVRLQSQIAMREQQHRDQHAAHQINFSTTVPPSTFSSSQPNAAVGHRNLDAFGNLVVPSTANNGVTIHEIEDDGDLAKKEEDDGDDHGLDLSLRL